MIQYLTGCHGEAVAAVAHERNIGLLVQPGNSYHKLVHKYPVWAGDNGAFTTKADGFSPERFRAMLRQPELQAAKDRCLFVTAPDKLVVMPDGKVVGDAAGTLDQFPAWAREIREAGFPVALVAQNGLEHMLWRMYKEDIWSLVDVLFLGGGPDPELVTPENPKGEWKLSQGGRTCAFAAKMRRKRTHMGRVNSYTRLQHGQTILGGAPINTDGERMPGGCIDTADGTFLKFAGQAGGVPRLLGFLDKLTPDPPPYHYESVRLEVNLVSFETGDEYMARRERERAAEAQARAEVQARLAAASPAKAELSCALAS